MSNSISNETHSTIPSATRTQSSLGMLKRLRKCRGIMLAETMVAAAVLGLVIVGTSHAMLIANRIAADSRVLTGARAVLQRNIDTALASTFTQSNTPTILVPSVLPNGDPYDDDGGFDSAVQISVQDNGTAVVASGKLYRTVVTIPNADNADIRKITFRLEYTYRGRLVILSMSTIRSRDD